MKHCAEVLQSQEGYDLASPFYETWRWFEFWRLNEAPIVRSWLRSLSPGVGLDVGSGTGAYLTDIAAAGHCHVAVDLSFGMLAVRRERAEAFPGVHIVSAQANAALLPFVDGAFDWVLCARVLSHVSDLKAVLREFRRVLRPGGNLLISDVHPEHPYTRVSIQTEDGEIAIETHKHSIVDLRTSIVDADGLILRALNEYRLDDLSWKPPKDLFGKLYRYPDQPVFYVCRMDRC